jgi:hypothetical protein
MLQTGVWLFPIRRIREVAKVTILSQARQNLDGFAAGANSATSTDLGEHFDANLPLPILLKGLQRGNRTKDPVKSLGTTGSTYTYGRCRA